MSEFTPAQLDALEDALEGLPEGAPAGFRRHADPEIAARLEEYDELLSLYRELLPTEDVPPGLLDSVLAYAEEEPAAQRSDVGLTAAPGTVAEPWWRRFGKLLAIPAFAVAGSMALVLWLVVVDSPTHESAVAQKVSPPADAPPAPAAEAEPAPLAPVERTMDKALAEAPLAGLDAEDGPRRGEGLATQQPSEPEPLLQESAASYGLGSGKGGSSLRRRSKTETPGLDDEISPKSKSVGAKAPSKLSPPPAGAARPSSAPDAWEEPAAPAAAPKPSTQSRSDAEETRAEKKKRAEPPLEVSKDASAKEEDASPAPPPAAEPADGGDPWAVISRADALRRAKNCEAARGAYAEVQDHATASVRARAFAGLGLCEAALGRETTAQAFFARAKAADKAVAKFIDRELGSTKTSARP